jgi:NSS family neurotransmitter:Na+ symporter
MTEKTSIHGQWSNRLMFILAATGSAVGLGNIWKFPYIAGENGGGAFVLVYLICIAIIGIPIMMAEILIGRRGRQSPINTMRTLAKVEGVSRYWVLLGWGGVLAGFFILSYYSVIAGWAMAYIFRVAGGMFSGADADTVKTIFSDLVGAPERLLAWHTIFMVLAIGVVARGVRHGLEKAVRVLMPALMLLLIVMVGYAYSTTADSFFEGARFLFTPDFSKLFYQCEMIDDVESCMFSAEPLLVAMGHAFFTLSLGMGAIMVYGSYMPQSSSIASSAIAIGILDTTVALLAGMAIFPLVFANGLEPAESAGLVFKTLPIAFGEMPGGVFFGALFFVLLLFAALTSAISLVEPAVAWLVENRGFSRLRAAIMVGVLVWLLGIGTVFSFNLWAEVKLFDKTFFELLDFLTANIMLPLGGLLIAVFAGWQMHRSSTMDELAIGDGLRYAVWHNVIKYVTPVAVVLVFLYATGLFSKLGLI